MTEQEWLASTDPGKILDLFRRTDAYQAQPPFRVLSDRKLRLFACACCRSVWHLLTDERSRRAVEVAERYADWLATAMDLRQHRSSASAARNYLQESSESYPAWLAHVCTAEHSASIVHVTQRQTELAHLVPPSVQASFLHCIIGNPFRPVERLYAEVGECPPCADCGLYHPATAFISDPVAGTVHVYRPVEVTPWLTHGVIALATAAYQERGRKCGRCAGGFYYCAECGEYTNRANLASHPHTRQAMCCGKFAVKTLKCPDCHGTGRIEDGTLDPDQLAVLADALEDAGCTDDTILSHLRGPGPHARGCHVLDALLGEG